MKRLSIQQIIMLDLAAGSMSQEQLLDWIIKHS